MNGNRTKTNPKQMETGVMTGENVQEPGIFGRYFQPYTDEFYLLFRLVFATLVGLHGAQKAFLLWNFPAGAESERAGHAGRHCRLGRAHCGTSHRARCADPIGGRSAGCDDDCRILWSSRCTQHGMALAAPVSQPARRRQRLRTARWRVTILWFICAGIIGILGSRKWGLERHFFNKEHL